MHSIKMMELKAYTAFGEMGFGKTEFCETGRHQGIQSCLSVSLSVCPRSKRKTA